MFLSVFIEIDVACRLSRKTFDTPETYKEFGPIRIEFGKASCVTICVLAGYVENCLRDFYDNVLLYYCTDSVCPLSVAFRCSA